MEKNVRNPNLFSVEFPDDDRESFGVTKYEVVKRRKDNGQGGQWTENGELVLGEDGDQGASGERDTDTDSRARGADEATAGRAVDGVTADSGRYIPAGDGDPGSVHGTDRDRNDVERTGETGDESRTGDEFNNANNDNVKSHIGVSRKAAEKDIKTTNAKVDDFHDGEFEWGLEPVRSEKRVKETNKTARHIKNERILSEKKETGKTVHQNVGKTVEQHKHPKRRVVAHVQAKSDRNVYKTSTDAPRALVVKESRPKGTGTHSFEVVERLYKKRKIWDKDIDYRIGPGPANYMLPTTVGRNSVDFTKRGSPAFSFGSRTWSIKSESPGPAYQFDPLLGPRGKENTPAYSFGGRPKTPGRRDLSPGPAAYSTDKKPTWEKNAPAYSMSPRNKQRAIDVVPSPGSYEIPTTIGPKIPHMKGGVAQSMVGKSDYMSYQADLAKSPGPAYYPSFSPNLVKRKSPEFSIKGRNYYQKMNPTPGPGAYNPQDVNSHMATSPRAVMGVKHSEHKMPTLTLADISD